MVAHSPARNNRAHSARTAIKNKKWTTWSSEATTKLEGPSTLKRIESGRAGRNREKRRERGKSSHAKTQRRKGGGEDPAFGQGQRAGTGKPGFDPDIVTDPCYDKVRDKVCDEVYSTVP